MLYILYLLAIIVLISADQFSKLLIVRNMNEGSYIEIIHNFFSIRYVKNYGAGFSIMQNQRVFLIGITVIVTIVLIYLLFKSSNKEALNRTCYILAIGGAIGNLIDRINLGYVVDFLDFYIFGYDFPVFNLADSFLTIGAFILLIAIFVESRRGKNKTNS